VIRPRRRDRLVGKIPTIDTQLKFANMTDNAPDRRSLLRQEGCDLSDASIAIASPSQASVPLQRHGYRRMPSQGSGDFETMIQHPQSNIASNPDSKDSEYCDRDRNVHSLSIATARPISIARVPVGGRTPPALQSPLNPLSSSSTGARGSPFTPQTPGTKPLLSSAWQRHDSRDYTYGYDGGGPGPMHEEPLDGQDITKSTRKTTSFQRSLDDAFIEDSGDQRLKSRASTINDYDNNG
jgi:hypothetical protein